MDMPKQNTDKELYRETEGDYYSPSLHVTKDGLIGIDVGGSVHVMRLRDWHERAQAFIVKTETTHNSGYMIHKAKALLSQIAKATSYIRKRCGKAGERKEQYEKTFYERKYHKINHGQLFLFA